MIVFDPNNFPPTAPEHVRFSEGTQLIIESLSAEGPSENVAHDRNRLYNVGEAIGRTLYANIYGHTNGAGADGDFLRGIGRHLTSHWEGDDFDEEFHRGLNWGIQNEHADTAKGGLTPDEEENLI